MERHALRDQEIIHADSAFPVSLTLIVAVLLLAIGLVAVVNMVFNVGPFG